MTRSNIFEIIKNLCTDEFSKSVNSLKEMVYEFYILLDIYRREVMYTKMFKYLFSEKKYYTNEEICFEIIISKNKLYAFINENEMFVRGIIEENANYLELKKHLKNRL